jgi:hypothetical protein
LFLDDPPIDQLTKIYPANYYSYEPSRQLTSLTERIKSYLDTRMFRKLLRKIPGESLRVTACGRRVGVAVVHTWESFSAGGGDP